MIAIDIGNAFACSFDGKTIKSIRSAIAPLQSRVNIRGESDESSRVIEYDAKLYHVGDAAFKYNIHRLLAETDKQTSSSISDSVLLLLALLTPDRGAVPSETRILISVPETLTNYQHDLASSIRGTKTWSEGKRQFSTNVVLNGVYPEGYGSWFVARKHLPSIGYTLVLDIGGGTVITCLIENETGEVITSMSNKGTGMIYLANLLRSDMGLRYTMNGDIPTVQGLFKAIESKSMTYGLTGNISIADQLNFYLPQWWKHIMSEVVVNNYRQPLATRVITKILVTGGGAMLVKPMIEAAQNKGGVGELFLLAQNPLEDNVRGMYAAANNS